jgi:hypothetical protein
MLRTALTARTSSPSVFPQLLYQLLDYDGRAENHQDKLDKSNFLPGGRFVECTILMDPCLPNAFVDLWFRFTHSVMISRKSSEVLYPIAHTTPNQHRRVLVVQNHIGQQFRSDDQLSVVVDESHLPELVHKVSDARACRTYHFGKCFVT